MTRDDRTYSRPPPAWHDGHSPGALASESAIHKHALETLAPPSILVDASNRIVHLSENAGRYLLHPGGPITSDVVDLVRPELRPDLQVGLHRAFEFDQCSLSLSIPVQFNGDARRVFLQIRPVHAENAVERALVLFIEGDSITDIRESTVAGGQDHEPAEAFRQLREELNVMSARLSQSRQQYGAAIQELRASNEELQSTNEEYRSTAEELETGKEELQSSNEELRTVNNELKDKLASLSRANNDIENLIVSAGIATLFLDRDLRIKRFTPQISELFSITPTDVGSPRHRFDKSVGV